MALTASHLADLPLHPACHPSSRRADAVYARRRLVAMVLGAAVVVLLVAATVSVAHSVGVASGGDPASGPGRHPAPVAEATSATARYVVQPGDTLWSIARSIRPQGDVRNLVRLLKRANGGSASLQPGQVLVLPDL
ncbi:MAG TPA: LysM peptidoglycan-binding domain-containing protein [Acidimicrobiales bacterium]